KPAWTGDFAENPALARAGVASEVGIRSGTALPVLVGRDVVAILEFFTPDIVGSDETLLEIMGSVGLQLGRVVERKRAEETRFKAVVDNMPAVVSLRDLDGRFILVNQRYEEFCGVSNAAVRGKTVYEVFSKRDADVAATLDQEVIRRREVVEREITYRRNGGSHIFHAVKFPIHDASGEITAVAGVELDITGRKEAERALAQASEAKDAALRELQAVLDAIEYGVLFVDADLRLRLANRAYRQIWQIPSDFFTPERTLRDDMLLTRRKGLYEVSDDEWESYIAARIEEIQRGKVGPDEMRLADGRVLQYQCISLPDGGRMLTYFDITDLKTAEEALRASEKRLIDAIESISEAFALCDADDRLVICNNRYREVFFPGHEDLVRLGETFESVLRANVALGMLKTDDEDVEPLLADRMARHRDPTGPFLQEQGDGRWIQINERKTEDGGIVAVGTDITELKQQQAALRESEERYALAMAGANEGLWDWKPESNEIVISDTMRSLLGLDTLDRTITPADWEARIHPDDLEQHLAAVKAHLRGKTELFTSEYRVLGRDGQYRWVLNRGLGLRDETGRVYRMAGSLGDVTARKRAEIRLKEARDQAMQATQAKSQFLANMSHELRTPLNAIIGFTQLVMERAGEALPSRQHENLKKILVSAEHLLALINDVLDLSKIEAGHMEVHPTDVDLAHLVELCLRTVEPMAAGRELRLISQVGRDLPTLHTDQNKLRQILINLLSNAAKFTDSGAVTVSAEHVEDLVRISVADTGIGIAEDALEFVFDEFRQADESTTREHGGTGLGLAITRRLARLLGGDVAVRSKLGEGSTFTVVVPVTYSATRPPAKARPQAAEESGDERARDGPLVLAIDDDPNVIYLLREHLADAGYRVIGATGGEEGIRKAKLLKPFAITLDIIMPNHDGWEVLRALKADEATRDVPIIVLSILDEKDRGFRLGAFDYLLKPFDRDMVLSTLKRIAPFEGRVLVVDDDPMVGDLIEQILEDRPYEIDKARDGVEALKIIEKRRPDVVLLDLLMPRLDGFGVVEVLEGRPECRDIPIVVLTSKSLTQAERKSLDKHVLKIIEKRGLAPDALLRELSDVLPRRHARANNGEDR
ncbi:MAG: PAS-domain containing protein, partial [Alphaproteobacteria bacterium]